jgi:Mg2+-importing ATPase
MLKFFGRFLHSKKDSPASTFDAERLYLASRMSVDAALDYYQTSSSGISDDEANEREAKYGANEVVHEQRKSPVSMLVKAFINPFVGVLTALIVITLLLDVLHSEPEEQDWTTIAIISVMVVGSAVLRFVQEWKAEKSGDALQRMVTNTCAVKREGAALTEMDIRGLVPGDIVQLGAGDMIPADIRIIEAKDLFVSQSSLTGEADSIEKTARPTDPSQRHGSVIELQNICFMGSNVVSGSARAIVVATGNDTYLGAIARNISGHRALTAFDKGISRVSMLLIRFMLVMVPFVFLVNGITKGDWLEAFVFAISVAVGLTPEMLPMIVTANLSKGAVAMSRKKTIVKDLNAIQNFGAMNILCTDKTGTLTRDEIVLERYITADGNEDEQRRVLRHAYFNSYFQTGIRNLMDKAILNHVNDLNLGSLSDNYRKVDEIPFDFTRRRMSVVVERINDGKRQIITKGAVEEMLNVCSWCEDNGAVSPLSDELRAKAREIVSTMNRRGMRVLAVAQKSFLDKDHDFCVGDEHEMVLIGYLAFLDPPKESAANAIRRLHDAGIEVKVLSGDNDAVVETISSQVGIPVTNALTGSEFAALGDDEKHRAVEETTVFSKLTPLQKTEIIKLLQSDGHTVGFLGDGINDASALRQSDIGISVDSAVDIAKESADIILLEKDLNVLGDGVMEGRRTFGNITKYIKMTASSNFGNMFSVLAASAFLPFLPMMPIHLIVQNLLYDISQTTIPFDRMDEEYLRKPRKWDASDLSRFMICIGPISSIFDIATYLVMWFVFGCTTIAHESLFQTGWFVEGLLSQTLIVHMIRTRRIPFLQSRAAWPVTGLTLLIIAIGIAIPFTPFGTSIGLSPLPLSYFGWLMLILFSYCALTQLVKTVYIRHFHRWL